MKKVSLLASLLFLFSTVSYAHGPVRGRMTATLDIEAPAAEVWAVIQHFNDMSWHPAIKSVSATGGNTKGATRTLTLASGGTITEELKKYDAKKMMYKYKITDMSTAKTVIYSNNEIKIPVLPVNNYGSTISVASKGNASVVTWVATYYRAYINNVNPKDNPPVEITEAASDKAVTAVFTMGLTALLHNFEPNTLSAAIHFKMKR
jgi:mxaD protein